MFHLFKYVVDHENVRAFFLISLRTCSKLLNDALLCVIPSVLLAASFQLRARHSSHRFIAIHILLMNIWILWKSSMMNKNNLENNLERNLTTDWASECNFRASEGTNFENYSNRYQLWWHLCGFDVCTPLPKKVLDYLLSLFGSDIYIGIWHITYIHRISSNKHRTSNKRLPLIGATPINVALIRTVTTVH